jgi:hypothetical protein
MIIYQSRPDGRTARFNLYRRNLLHMDEVGPAAGEAPMLSCIPAFGNVPDVPFRGLFSEA